MTTFQKHVLRLLLGIYRATVCKDRVITGITFDLLKEIEDSLKG